MSKNETKHTEGEYTPGPWYVHSVSYAAKDGLVVTDRADNPNGHRLCAQLGLGGGPDEVRAEDAANARLIASAPDMAAELARLRACNAEMLAALNDAMDYFNHSRSGREYRDNGGEEPVTIAKAIATAEGRP